MEDDVQVTNFTRDYTEGNFIEVGTCPDNQKFLVFRTTEDASVAYFGDMEFMLTPKFAKALGKALIAQAEICESAE